LVLLFAPMKKFRWILIHLRAAPILCALVACTNAAVASENCLKDLEVIPPFLLENDAGAKDELATMGQAHFDVAMAQAREGAAEAGDSAACDKVLNGYLKAWRKGHLSVNAVKPERTTPEPAEANLRTSLLPTIKLLSERTALLTVPTFAGQYREPLIRLLAHQHKQLATRANWIIDVRNNGGGDDSTFEPLLPWLMPDEREDVGAAWLVTAANIEGQGKACSLFAPGDKDCEESLAEAVKRMRAASSGSYVQQEDGPPIHFLRAEKLELHRPARVAVMIDSHCGSSCEEFLLAVRQSFNVKLIGRRSYGSLDYSNLRPHLLPSGERMLMYAISRTNRLPGLPVDVAGIQPDIFLPEPSDGKARADEVLQVQRWLEGGSLAPSTAGGGAK
jgi:hypothetical protein